MAQTVEGAEISQGDFALFMSLDARAAMVELANVLEATVEAADFRGR